MTSMRGWCVVSDDGTGNPDKEADDVDAAATASLFSTEGSGKQLETVDSVPEDPAVAALKGAQSRFRRGTDAGRQTRLANLRGRGRKDKESSDGVRRGGYSGPAPDETDPQRVGDVLSGYVKERGWDRPLAEARIFAEWDGLVGADIAAHCRPDTLNSGELRVTAESTAWATQLRLLAPAILKRLGAELGSETVKRLVFSGPSAPSWRHGAWSVRGARGPRDTYG